MPNYLRDAFIAARSKLAAPPFEDIILHEYELQPDPSPQRRLNFVIPSIAAKAIFGGVSTGVDFLFTCGHALDMPLRIVIDDFNDETDVTFIARAAERAGFPFERIEFVARTAVKQPLPVRENDLFIAYNWWVALNLRGLLAQQKAHFHGEKLRPLVYLVQDYEPGFYPWSSTHMVARASLDSTGRTFGVFNSHQLHDYFHAQGHAYEREFVIPLRMSKSLKAVRSDDHPAKLNKILVYGRPAINRNCFPAIIAGLKAFVHSHDEFRDWSIESAGAPHAPIDLGRGKKLAPLGKLTLEQYARKLETTAVGLSLMASPHPSYPPLEMAHFGVRVITNSYACKDLSKAHENIVSLENILPESISEALAGQCRAFLGDRDAGWRAKSMMPDYLSDDNYPFMDQFVEAIRGEGF